MRQNTNIECRRNPCHWCVYLMTPPPLGWNTRNSMDDLKSKPNQKTTNFGFLKKNNADVRLVSMNFVPANGKQTESKIGGMRFLFLCQCDIFCQLQKSGAKSPMVGIKGIFFANIGKCEDFQGSVYREKKMYRVRPRKSA